MASHHPVRFRIKGTTAYVEPMARPARADGSAYLTTGGGARSNRWRAPAYGPNAALDYSAVGLRNQSRELIRKNAMASSALERFVSNVVGTGIKPKLEDMALAKVWNRWTDESAADGMLDFYGQQAQVAGSVFAAGECFTRKRNRRPSDGLSVPLQIEVLEPEFIPMDHNRPAEGGRGEIRQGIEFDAVLKSKRVAYWVLPRHPDDASMSVADPTPVRVPASEIDHQFWPTRPGQIRGEPWMARVLDLLSDVVSYDKAELQRKKTAAMFVGFVKRDLPEGLSLDQLVEAYGEGEGADATAIRNRVGEATLMPGTMQYLAPDEEVTFASPSDVGSSYEAFLRQQYRGIAASLGLLYEQLTGDYSQVNDRTWRAAVTEFRRRCSMWQHHLMVFQFCRPTWQRWADLANLARAVPARLDPFEPVVWTPQRWDYINPVQDVQAKREEVLAGFVSRSEVVSEMGRDASVIDAEQEEDNARAEKAGLVYASSTAKADVKPEPAQMSLPLDEQDDEDKPKGAQGAAVKAMAQMAQDMTATFAEAFKGLAVNTKPEGPQSVNLTVPERIILDANTAAAAVRSEIESRDEAGRAKTIMRRPSTGEGATIRRHVFYDANGKVSATEDEVIPGG